MCCPERDPSACLSLFSWLLVAVVVILPRGALAQTVGHWRIDPITCSGQTTQSSDQPRYYSHGHDGAGNATVSINVLLEEI